MSGNKYLINESHLFDPERKTISVQPENNRNIILGNNESDIFLTLLERRPEVLSKDKLVELVWEGKGSVVNDSSVVQSVSTLRRALNDSTKLPLFIRTVPKKGYQFVGIITDVIEKKPVLDKSVLELTTNAESNENNFTTPKSVEDKVAIDNNKSSILSLSLIAMMSFSLCIYLFYSSKQEIKTTNLVTVGEYEGVPVLSIRQENNNHLDITQIISSIPELVEDTSEIEKFILASSSRGDLIVNTIYLNQMKNKTFIIDQHIIK